LGVRLANGGRLKIVYAILLASLTLSACAKNERSGPSGTNPPPEIKAQNVDGSVWLVKGKSCGSQQQAVLGVERLQFDNGLFAHIFLVSDDQSKTCNEAQVFNRIIQQTGTQSATYNETAILSAQQKRTVCRDKSSSANVSDDTTTLSGPDENLAISITGNSGTADLTGSPFCQGRVLHFELNKK